jgi:eukaryotic-like serine/threonine-protein kinase
VSVVRDPEEPGSRPSGTVLADTRPTGERLAEARLAGTRLDRWLEEGTRSWRDVLNVLLDVGQELTAVHAAGHAHQEVRLEQIVVGNDGRARLAGSAPPVTNLPKVGPSGLRTAAVPLEERLAEMKSTDAAAYLAPEQFRGWVADARSNQFSFCVAFYRALYRQAPFDPEWAISEEGATQNEPRRTPIGSIHYAVLIQAYNRTTLMNLAREVLAGNVRPVPENTDVPVWLLRVLLRGMQPDPDERYASMDDLLDDLVVRGGKIVKRRLGRRRLRLGAPGIVGLVGLLLLLGLLAKLAGWL